MHFVALCKLRGVAFDVKEKKVSLKNKVLATWSHMSEQTRYRYVIYHLYPYVGMDPCPVHKDGKLSHVTEMKEFLRSCRVPFEDKEKKGSLKAKVLAEWSLRSNSEQRPYLGY